MEHWSSKSKPISMSSHFSSVIPNYLCPVAILWRDLLFKSVRKIEKIISRMNGMKLLSWYLGFEVCFLLVAIVVLFRKRSLFFCISYKTNNFLWKYLLRSTLASFELYIIDIIPKNIIIVLTLAPLSSCSSTNSFPWHCWSFS